MTDLPHLSNLQARRIFMDRHLLSRSPAGRLTKAGLLDIIQSLGFVQVDSVNTVERAHHMILFARGQSYNKNHLKSLLEKDRALFENWTHDASIIPVEFHPHWHLRFDRERQRLAHRWQEWRRDGFAEKFDAVLEQIREHGACGSREVGSEEERTSGGWWDWHPSKTALEYLWRTGELAVCHRVGFQKQYDLAERVIPARFLNRSDEDQIVIDWACESALARLGFATHGEIAAFWDKISPAEAKDWCQRQLACGDLVEIAFATANGEKPRQAYARPGILEEAKNAPSPPSRLRILSPFDPALRDRKRAARLFNFDYRIEIFVPEAKRKYGYYVFPVLEGDRLVGRIDMKAFRDDDTLRVRAYWPERGLSLSKQRLHKLELELERMARFAKVKAIEFVDDWVRAPQ